MILSTEVFDAAMHEIVLKSKNRLYQRDFAAWQSDVLGERTYAKMEEIGHDVLLGAKPRTMVKSANGSAKTFQAARWGMWWVTAFPPEESLAIFTAPTLFQVEVGIMAYLKSCYGHVKRTAIAQEKPMPWPGWINEQNEWQYSTDGGNALLAFGRVPGAHDAVSTFQGARKPGGRNLILLDEAGGVSEDIFTAIEALITGGDSRMAGIGNPDRRGTKFHETFSNPRQAAEYNLHTISAFDLPTLTGEVVYPDDPEKQALMLKGLTSKSWVENKDRIWKNEEGKPNGLYMAKVLGEFPGDTDNSYFPESDIRAAQTREIDPANSPVVIGVDLAAMGEDESVVYVNRGGHVRVFSETIHYDDGGVDRTTSGTWTKENEFSSARRVYAIAKYLDAQEVRVDAAGLGGGIASILEHAPELQGDYQYMLVRIIGSNMSSDKDRWSNARTENHARLKELLRIGAIDIDPDDSGLDKELMAVTYSLNNRDAEQITPKKEMRTEMGGSPDRLDALIYAVFNTDPLLMNPLAGMKKGDVATLSPYDILQAQRGSPGWPV